MFQLCDGAAQSITEDASGDEDAMSTAESLLTKKMQLLALLREDPDRDEREEIERRLAEINQALTALELEPRRRRAG